MTKLDTPVFHIPIGRHRQNGEIVPFDSVADQIDATRMWMVMVMEHPRTRAARGCAVVGPTTTMHIDALAHVVTQSTTTDGAWRPSACDDLRH